MKTKSRPWLFILIVAVSIVFCEPAQAQSNADWTAFKRVNGINPSWTYNQWVAAGCPRGGGGGNSVGGNSGPTPAQIAAQQAVTAKKAAADAQKEHQDKADSFTQQGSDAFSRNEYEAAIKYFQDALEITPDDSTLSDRIQKAKDAMAAIKHREQEAFDKSKQEGLSQLKGLAQGGSFDASTDLRGPNSTDTGLKGMDDGSSGLKILAVNTDLMVVDARNVSSGLPKSVDDAIAAGYAVAPPGVGDRVRKAFQAIQTHDWKVARAWFQDALNHDPGNAGLKRLVDLADYTEKFSEQKVASATVPAEKAATTEEIPPNADARTYALTSGKIHTHEAWVKFIQSRYPQSGPLSLPNESDINFLFPGLPAIEAQEMDDYLMDGMIKMTENDPQLNQISQPKANQPQQPVSNQSKNSFDPYQLK